MGKPCQKRRAGHPKRAQWLRRDRLEKLLTLLHAKGGFVSLKNLRSYHSFPRWEVKLAELLGWVRIGKGPRPRSGQRPTLVWPEEDTSQARQPAEEWEVPLVIPDTHRAFAARTLDIVGYNMRRGGIPIYKSVTVAYREAHAGCHRSRPSYAYQMLKRGDVQAVRAWLLAQTCGDIDADEEIPDTVGGIEFRLRGAGWTDGQFAWAREVGRRKAAGREMEVERGDAPSVLQETLKWLDAETRRVEQQREQIPEAGLEKERSLELRAVPVAKREGGVLRGPLGGIGVPRTRASPLAA